MFEHWLLDCARNYGLIEVAKRKISVSKTIFCVRYGFAVADA